MKSAARRLAAPFPLPLVLLAALALGTSLLGCSSNSTGDSSVTETTFDIRLTTGTSMRGVSVTLRHAADFDLVLLEDGDPPISAGSCTENVTAGQIRATCATTTSFSAPIDAWRVTLSHPADRGLDVGILELTCTGSDALGNTFAIGCQVVE